MNISRPPGRLKIAWRWFRSGPLPAVSLTAGAILLEWALLFLGPLSWLMLLPIGIWLKKRKWLPAAICALLSPVAVSFLVGVSDYARGRAAWLVKGYMRLGTVAYEPSLGLRCQSTGCIVMGSEWANEGSYNLAVQTLTKVFGLQQHAYTGPCPEVDEALKEIENGAPINEQLLGTDVIDAGGKRIALTPGTGATLLNAIQSERSTFAPLGMGPYQFDPI